MKLEKYGRGIQKTLHVYEKGAVGLKHAFLCILHDCRMQGNTLQMKKPSSLKILAAHSNAEMITDRLPR
jgi:hypothetical protein